MISKVLNFIKEYNLTGKTIVLGFSGGYDSMCLLDILDKVSKEQNISLVAAHYNHNWRGQIAKIEQQCCADFCKVRNIEFYTETASDDVKKNETIARELRYAFFERVKNKYDADAVFTAHNYDDNAETILYRIVKGTGIVGLKGILPVREYFYRPLIEVSRNDIEAYCRNNNLVPNNDDSNSDNIHKRNLIRNKILPLLSEINQDVKKTLNSLSYIACSESNIVDEYIELISKDLFDEDKIKTPEFLKLSMDVKQKIIYNLIYYSEIDYDRYLICNIVDFILDVCEKNKPSKFSLSSDKWLYVDSNIIEIISTTCKSDQIVNVDSEGEYSFGKYVFTMERYNGDYEKQKDEFNVLVDLSKVGDIVLRTRRDGDIIKPLGFDGTMKLKKYLMSKDIPQHKRDEIVLLCEGKEVLWVAGIGLNDKIKTISKPTHKLSVITKEED